MIDGLTEITRSFSYKLNCEIYGGAKYESREFFVSRKATCLCSQAVEASAEIYNFCESEVMKAVAKHISKLRESSGRNKPSDIEIDVRADVREEKLAAVPRPTCCLKHQDMGYDDGSLCFGEFQTGGGRKVHATQAVAGSLTQDQFVTKPTGLTSEHLAGLAPAEREKRLEAAENRVGLKDHVSQSERVITEEMGLNPLPKNDDEEEQKNKARCSELKYEIIALVGGLSDRSKNEYLQGWFGVADGRGIPRKFKKIIEPLEKLLASAKHATATAGELIERPRELGGALRALREVDLRKTLDEVVAKQEAKHPTPPAAPAPEVVLTDDDVFELDDPLAKRFGWKNIHTCLIARDLLVKWNKTIDDFEKYLKFLKIDRLAEQDASCLLQLLYHDPSAFNLWKAAEQKNVSVEAAFNAVRAKMPGQQLTSSSLTSDVVIAMATAALEL